MCVRLYIARMGKPAEGRHVQGNPVHSSDTVYFTVSDQWGNACSYIQSNYAGEWLISEGLGLWSLLANICQNFLEWP